MNRADCVFLISMVLIFFFFFLKAFAAMVGFLGLSSVIFVDSVPVNGSGLGKRRAPTPSSRWALPPVVFMKKKENLT